jgi:hypothetical protein
MPFERDAMTLYIEDLTNTRLIALMLTVSPRARDVYTSEAYRFSVENEAFVDEQLVFDTLFETLMGELKELGVELLLDESEIWQYRDYTAAAIELRYRLDAGYLESHLMSLTDEALDRFSSAVMAHEDLLQAFLDTHGPYMLANEQFAMLSKNGKKLFELGIGTSGHISSVLDDVLYRRGSEVTDKEINDAVNEE